MAIDNEETALKKLNARPSFLLLCFEALYLEETELFEDSPAKLLCPIQCTEESDSKHPLEAGKIFPKLCFYCDLVNKKCEEIACDTNIDKPFFTLTECDSCAEESPSDEPASDASSHWSAGKACPILGLPCMKNNPLEEAIAREKTTRINCHRKEKTNKIYIVEKLLNASSQNSWATCA